MGRKRKKSRGHHTSDLLSLRLAHLLIFLTWNNAFLFFPMRQFVLASVTCKKECFQVKEFLERAISSFFERALEHFLSRAMPKSLTWLWWCKSQRRLPWCCLSSSGPCCLLFYRWPVGGRDLDLLCQISGSPGFLVQVSC